MNYRKYCEYIELSERFVETDIFKNRDAQTFKVFLNIMFERDCGTNSLECTYGWLADESDLTEYDLKKALLKLEKENYIQLYKSERKNKIIIALRRNDEYYLIGDYELFLDKYKEIAVPRRIPRDSKGYDKFKKKVLERDDYTCQLCGAKNDLVVHHKKSYDKYQRLRTVISNGITLCNNCHKKIHSKGGAEL